MRIQRGDYGYDAPFAPIMLGAFAAVAGAYAGFAWRTGAHRSAVVTSLYALFFAANVFSFLYTTRRGKFEVWREILDRLALGGNERILDLGCGRGAVLTAVAARLTTGSVTGVDIWSKKDQSGNAKEATLRNAEVEGVRDRVRLETGDMRALTFADDSFDVIVSSLAIHNISGAAERAKAIAEAFRVLKPGGRLVIADIRSTARYASTLNRLGALRVQRRGLGWRFWYGNPLAATTLVTATKPVAVK
jgi:SAM-dependent methyltransferase